MSTATTDRSKFEEEFNRMLHAKTFSEWLGPCEDGDYQLKSLELMREAWEGGLAAGKRLAASAPDADAAWNELLAARNVVDVGGDGEGGKMYVIGPQMKEVFVRLLRGKTGEMTCPHCNKEIK